MYSSSFKKKIKDAHGIVIYHLPTRCKAYLAELFIKHFKTQVCQALKSNNTKIWHTFILENIVKTHNNRLIKGTTIKRKELTVDNFTQYLQERTGYKYPRSLNNVSSVRYSTILNTKWKSKIFKNLKVGSKVLLKRSSNWMEKSKKYYKSSEVGGYTSTIYTIESLTLKPNNRLFLVPTLTLKGVKGLWYPSEVLLISPKHNESE